jgi:hypothetical protein
VQSREDPQSAGRRERLDALCGGLRETDVVEKPLDIAVFAAARHARRMIAEQMLNYAAF